MKLARTIEFKNNSGNFQQRIPLRVKASRFNVDNHGKKTTEPVGNFC